MTRDDNSLAAILLVSRLCAKGVRPLKASEFWTLQELMTTGNSHADRTNTTGNPNADRTNTTGNPNADRTSTGLGGLLGRSEEGLKDDWGLPASLAGRVAGLLGRATAVAFELERLEQSGIETITVFDERYPQRWQAGLGVKAPVVLHAAGAVEQLDTPGVGVVGSRNVSEAGAAIAGRVARHAADLGLPVVSGGARGVDQIAMNAAFEAGGAVVGILAESLLRKVKRPDVRKAVYEGSTLMCTPYGPNAPFNVGNAMGRNKLIYAQAALTVVVASDHGSGGTWSGATEAIKNDYGQVAVWSGEGEGPGNEPLQKLGAVPLSDPEEIRALIHDDHSQHEHSNRHSSTSHENRSRPRPPAPPTQMSMI